MVDSFLPTSYIYMNFFMLLFGMWGIVNNESADAMFMVKHFIMLLSFIIILYKVEGKELAIAKRISSYNSCNDDIYKRGILIQRISFVSVFSAQCYEFIDGHYFPRDLSTYW